MRFHRFLRATLVVAAALLAAACSARQIGQAQTAFNAAATLETTTDGLTPGGDTLVAQRAESSYRVARALVATEIASNAADLRADGLLGVAYTLKALAEWRLGDLGGDLAMVDAARRTVDEAEARPAEELSLGTRDRVVLRAIPGVADIVRGRLSAKAYGEPSGPRDCSRSAVSALDRALGIDGLPADHPVHVWVRLSQLKACQQWLAATDSLTGAEMDAERVVIWGEWERCARGLAPFFVGNDTLQDVVRKLGRSMGIPAARVEAIVRPTATLPATRPASASTDVDDGIPRFAHFVSYDLHFVGDPFSR